MCGAGRCAAVTRHHSCGHQLPKALRSSQRPGGYRVRTAVWEVCISAPHPAGFSRAVSHVATTKSSLQPPVPSGTWLVFLSGILLSPKLTRQKKERTMKNCLHPSFLPAGLGLGVGAAVLHELRRSSVSGRAARPAPEPPPPGPGSSPAATTSPIPTPTHRPESRAGPSPGTAAGQRREAG